LRQTKSGQKSPEFWPCNGPDPSTFETVVYSWKAGDTIPLGRRMLRVVGIRDDDADQPPVLIVEDVG
jgi:hypothetical protein